jgi:lipopolysaccharide export system permease protein
MVLFGFFSLVLVMVYWVNRAVLLFNHLIGDGQPIRVFLELTALSLPNVIRIMLPLAAFAASVYVMNRMSNESELVVAQSVGLSPFRLARPALVFGLVVAALVALLANVLVPASRTGLAERSAAMARNISARVLTEGKFIHPADNVTLFIRQITPLGEMRDVFLSDARTPGQRTTYSARRALLVKVDGGSKLVMFDGTAQTLTLATRKLAVTRFQSSTYDIGALIGNPAPRRRGLGELSTPELFAPTPALLKETGRSRAAFLYEAHARIAAPLIALAAALLGYASLMLGGFSRFGNWRQIAGGVVGLILLQMLVDWSAGIGPTRVALWPLAYLPPAAGLAAAALMLWQAGRPRRRRAPAEGLAAT